MDGGYLIHYGVKGQQHGVRRYQNKDGTWTEEGKLRRRVGNPKYVGPYGQLTDEGKIALRKAREQNKDLSEADRKEFGITNYQAKGGVLKKDEPLYRITSNATDNTALDRKYFSTNPAENNAWAQMFGDQYRRSKENTYSLMYAPVKDLKVSSNAQLGKEFYEKVLKKDLKNIDIDWLEAANMDYGFKDTVNKKNIVENDPWGNPKKDAALRFENRGNGHYGRLTFDKSNMKTVKERNEVLGSVASTMIAIQCKQGKKAVEAMLAAGYDAIPDVNGTDVSYDPIIVLKPDKKVKRVSTYRINDSALSKGYTDERWPLMRP